MTFDVSNELVIPLIFVAKPAPPAKWWSQQTGQRLGAEDGKLPTQPRRWGLGHVTGAARGAEQMCMARSALLSTKYTTAAGVTVTWRAALSAHRKEASSPNSSLKQETPPWALPNHSPCSICKQPTQTCPQPAKATTPGAPLRQRSPTAATGSRAGPRARAAAGTWLGAYGVLHFAVQPSICLVIRETTHFFQLQWNSAPLLYKGPMEPQCLICFQFKWKEKTTHFHLLSFCTSSGTISLHQEAANRARTALGAEKPRSWIFPPLWSFPAFPHKELFRVCGTCTNTATEMPEKERKEWSNTTAQGNKSWEELEGIFFTLLV